MLVATVLAILTKKISIGLLVGYVLIILGETVLFRSVSYGEHFRPQLFWSYTVWEKQKDQIIANILLFIPFGLIVGRLWKWKGIIAGIGISLAVELIQLTSSRGLFEFDDIIHNSLGTVIGVLVFIISEKVVAKAILDSKE